MLTDSEITPTPSQHRKMAQIQNHIRSKYPRGHVKSYTIRQIEEPHAFAGTLLVHVVLGGEDDDLDQVAHALRMDLKWTISPKGGLERLTPEGLFGAPKNPVPQPRSEDPNAEL